MALNKVKQGSQMYQFITHTWNPLAGECQHKCGYCSSHKFYYPVLVNKYSGPIRIEESCMKDNFGSGKFIFVVSQNDLFADNVPRELIKRILDYCNGFDCRYLFQTKNPGRIMEFHVYMPKGSTICTTIESNRRHGSMTNCPSPLSRAYEMAHLSTYFPTYVTIEPIMKFDLFDMTRMIRMCRPEQVNIGADSGHNNLSEPSRDELLSLIEKLKTFTKIDKKINLSRLLNS